MSRIVIDLPEKDIHLLDMIKDTLKKPRTEIIRTAISCYLEKNGVSETESAFGIWHMNNGDGLEYQESIRAEWSQ